MHVEADKTFAAFWASSNPCHQIYHHALSHLLKMYAEMVDFVGHTPRIWGNNKEASDIACNLGKAHELMMWTVG